MRSAYIVYVASVKSFWKIYLPIIRKDLKKIEIDDAQQDSLIAYSIKFYDR